VGRDWGAHAPRVFPSAPSPVGLAHGYAHQTAVQLNTNGVVGEGSDRSTRGACAPQFLLHGTAWMAANIDIVRTLALAFPARRKVAVLARPRFMCGAKLMCVSRGRRIARRPLSQGGKEDLIDSNPDVFSVTGTLFQL